MRPSRSTHPQLAAFALGTALLCVCAAQAAHARRVLPSLKSRTPTVEEQRPSSLPSDAELVRLGAVVGTIRFDARKLFDAEASDEDTSLSRLANRLHVTTREATIADQLLFKSGDPYQPGLLGESARILRDTRYLRDALVRPVAFHDGVVDIEVTTQDVWTFNPGISFGRSGGANSSGIELEELNFLGTGTQLGVGFKSEIDRDSKFVHFRDRQLGSSWWDLDTTYSDNSDGRLAELSLEHPFYALGSRWAGGVSLLDDRRTDSRYDLGQVIDQYEVREKRGTIYWGRSAGLKDGWARRLSLGLTYDDHAFGAVPGAVSAPAQLPVDRTFVYPWIGVEWVQDDFRTARNRDQIEKTEDYALGWHARAQLGYAASALGSDRNAVILAGAVSKGLALTERQSVFFDVNSRGRLEHGSVAGGLVESSARYYFRQSPRRMLFLGLSATVGSHLDLDQQVLLGGDNGLRGYPLRYQSGEGRWLFTAEQRLFSNWYPFQMFNVGGAVFYDMGASWGRDPLGAQSQGLLRDVGFGLRFGNSRSALGNVLHVDIAYPIDGDSSVDSLQFLVQTKKELLMTARLRPILRVETLVLVVVAWLIATANGAWWSAATAGRVLTDPANWLFVGACFVALAGLHFVLLAPFANRWTVRPLLAAVVIASAAVAYYMRTYAVMMDPTMIQNILKTDTHEAKELLSWSMVGAVALGSALPIAFIWWVRIEHGPLLRSLLTRAATLAAAFVVAVLSVLVVSRDITSLMRNQRELRYLITPGNFIYGLAGSVAREAHDARAPREPVGTDARVIRVAMAHKPRLFVLVVGETARAANFSLLGYGRPTTPELAKLDVVAFSNVTSCGTSTEVSVPCMFSPFGREDYDERRIRNSEGLLDVLVRAGYRVVWLDNQSGCKGVCQGAGVEYRKLDARSAPDLCDGDECQDGILVRGLQAELSRITSDRGEEAEKDVVIVLHMMGNHGPAYYRRYPVEFRRFVPDCATAELRKCTRQQVVNAYDNAIAYTDHVLAGVVETLRAAAALDTAMIYVSDHGESLGENGLYLHGLPYSIAPATQTHVPMIAWLSAGFAAGQFVDRRCVGAKAGEALSHDNLFHSVLGLLDVQTAVYKAGRDVFEGCRGGPKARFARN